MAVGKYVAPLENRLLHTIARYEPVILAPSGLRMLIVAAQEQETVQGQEGPQEEGPGPLRPQGLVWHQGEFTVPTDLIGRRQKC